MNTNYEPLKAFEKNCLGISGPVLWMCFLLNYTGFIPVRNRTSRL